MVIARNVARSAAIRNHVAVKVPVFSQVLFQKHRLRAGGLAIHRVVGAHHRSCASHRSRPERRQIRVFQIVL